MLVLPAVLVGMEVGSVSAEEVEVAALAASAKRVDTVVWALAWVLARVLVAVSVLPLLAVAPVVEVCLPHSQLRAQFLVGWCPLLVVREVYCLVVDGVGLNWDVAPLGVVPGSGSLSPIGGTGSGSSSPCFFALFFFGFFGLGSLFGLGSFSGSGAFFDLDTLAFFLSSPSWQRDLLFFVLIGVGRWPLLGPAYQIVQAIVTLLWGGGIPWGDYLPA